MAAPIAFRCGELEFSARYFASPRTAARAAARAAMLVAVFAVDSSESWVALLGRWRAVLQARRRHLRSEQPALVFVANRRAGAPTHVSDTDAYRTAVAYSVDLHVAVNSESPASARALGTLLCRELVRTPRRYEPFMIGPRASDALRDDAPRAGASAPLVDAFSARAYAFETDIEVPVVDTLTHGTSDVSCAVL